MFITSLLTLPSISRKTNVCCFLTLFLEICNAYAIRKCNRWIENQCLKKCTLLAGIGAIFVIYSIRIVSFKFSVLIVTLGCWLVHTLCSFTKVIFLKNAFDILHRDEICMKTCILIYICMCHLSYEFDRFEEEWIGLKWNLIKMACTDCLGLIHQGKIVVIVA